jgi:hypothetical protein
MDTLKILREEFPDEELKIIDGYDDCILGIEIPSMRIIYSANKIVDKLAEKMTEEEATDFYHQKIGSMQLEDRTPIFCHEF